MSKHVLTKLDKEAVIAEAEKSGQIYPLKQSWRRFNRFAAVLCFLLVITIPIGIWIWIAAGRGRVAIGEKGFVFKLYGSAAYAWTDIESFQPVGLGAAAMGGGLVGLALSSAVSARTEGLRGPIFMKLKGRRMMAQFPANQIANSVAMAREMERRTGLTIFPPETPAA